jgi:dynein heavy chain
MNPIVKCEDTNMVMSLLRFLENQLTPEVLKTCADRPEFLEANFVFCAVWAFGAALSIGDDGTDYKKNFSDWWKRSFKTVQFPPKDTVFDFYLMEDGTFDAWDMSPAYTKVEFDSRSMTMSEITVATSETASVNYWMQALVNGGYPIMLCGLSGTGKTQLVSGLLQSFKPEEHLSLSINMNFYSSGTALQAIMETALQKQTASTFGPPGGAKMVYFIDDLNLPMVDAYNTQSAIALVRQHLDYTHWYDPTKLSLKTIVNCQYITAMNPTAGSFLINPRLQRWFTTFAQAMPNLTSLSTIYEVKVSNPEA